MSQKRNSSKLQNAWWKEKSLVEKLITIIPLIIGILSVVYVGLTYHYTLLWNKQIYNYESYQKPLNCSVNWEETKTESQISGAKYTLTNVENFKLPNQRASIDPIMGGIKSVSALFYQQGECLAIVKLDMSDRIGHKDIPASEVGYLCDVITLYPQLFVEKGDSGTYYTSLFLIIEGYNKDRQIIPTVFEFAADKHGALTGKTEVRQYDDIDILFIDNKENAQIPDFDRSVLADYVSIKEHLQNGER